MEATFWHERWDAGVTPWDQADAHPMLVQRWDDLAVPSDATVFVPLCGSSVDMVWLAERGHRVVGAELSEVAVQAFFARCGLTPSARRAGGSTVFEAGPFELWCGDLFELPADVVDDARAVYDRASLVALPPELRRRYAAHLAALVPAGSVSFLITFVHDLGPSGGPPFSVAADEVASLFAPWFDVELIAAADVLDRNRALADRGVTTLEEELHVLRRRDGTIG